MNSKFSAYYKRSRTLLRAAQWQLADDTIPPEVVAPVISAAWRALRTGVEWGTEYARVQDKWEDATFSPTRDNCIAAADELERSLVNAKSDYLASHAKRLERLGAGCANVAQLVLCVIAATALGAGAYRVLLRPSSESGLHATYFSSVGFQGHPFLDVARNLHFNWSEKPPAHLRANRWFSARWEGCIYIGPEPAALMVETTENKLTVRLGEASAFTVTGNHVVDSGKQKSLKSATSQLLAPGVHPIVIESERNRVPTQHRIRLKHASGNVTAVEASALIPPGGNTRFDCQLFHNSTVETTRKKVANANVVL